MELLIKKIILKNDGDSAVNTFVGVDYIQKKRQAVN